MTSPEIEVATLKERMSNFDRNLQSLDKKVVDGFVEVKQLISKLGDKVDATNAADGIRYVTREYLENYVTESNRSLEEIKKIATTRSWLMGASGTLVGIMVTVITALLINYFR